MANETLFPGEPASPRCFLCGARMWDLAGRTLRWGEHVRHFAFACGSCGILTDRPVAGEACADEWRRACRDGEVAASAPDGLYGFDAYTLRSAATRHGVWAEPSDEAQREALRAPHSTLPGQARIEPLDAGPKVAFSLAVLCREGERDAALALARQPEVWYAAYVILLDGEGAAEERPGLRLHRRPLNGHFGEQRNAVQRLARHDWVLQLDADESLEEGAISGLPGLLGRLDETVVSVGLRRVNLVDGVQADLFPDTQYRLNRRDVVFEGRVHERPARPWQRSLLFLGGGIRHHLNRAHVESRSRRYETMAPGGGRLFEEADLLRPYRA